MASIYPRAREQKSFGSFLQKRTWFLRVWDGMAWRGVAAWRGFLGLVAVGLVVGWAARADTGVTATKGAPVAGRVLPARWEGLFRQWLPILVTYCDQVAEAATRVLKEPFPEKRVEAVEVGGAIIGKLVCYYVQGGFKKPDLLPKTLLHPVAPRSAPWQLSPVFQFYPETVDGVSKKVGVGYAKLRLVPPDAAAGAALAGLSTMRIKLSPSLMVHVQKGLPLVSRDVATCPGVPPHSTPPHKGEGDVAPCQ